MNSNAKGFSNEIVNLKSKLVKDRDYYKRLKNDMLNFGKNISSQLKSLSGETDNHLNEKFNEISKLVMRSHPLPSVADTLNMLTVALQKPDTTLVNHVSPINIILSCYENCIIPLKDTINVWNNKALTLIHQDAKTGNTIRTF